MWKIIAVIVAIGLGLFWMYDSGYRAGHNSVVFEHLDEKSSVYDIFCTENGWEKGSVCLNRACVKFDEFGIDMYKDVCLNEGGIGWCE